VIQQLRHHVAERFLCGIVLHMKKVIFILLGLAVALVVGFVIFSRPAVAP